MAVRYDDPVPQALDTAGVSIAGARLFFFAAETNTPLATFSDEDLVNINTNPVIADGSGRFGNIFLQNFFYKVRLEDANGVQIWERDRVSSVDPSTNPVGPVDVIIQFPDPVTAGTINATTINTTTLTATGAISGQTLNATNEVATRSNLGLEIGVDVQAFDSDLSTYAANALTAAELQQLQNINSVTISSTQWGYLGDFDQALTSSSDVTFNALDVTDGATTRSNLGLEIGTDVQAFDAALQSIADLTTAADRMIFTTAADVYDVTTLTSFARSILDDADASAVRSTIGTVIGTDVQAQSSDLDTYVSNPLTANELQQLQNIDSVTISNTQWGFVGGLDQALATTDDVTFNDVTSSGDVSVGGKFNLGTPTELTIAANAVTITKSYHSLDTEGGVPSDDLITINGGEDGDIVTMFLEDGGREVTVRQRALGVGNILLGGDFLLANAADTLTLIFSNGFWRQLSQSVNV